MVWSPPDETYVTPFNLINPLDFCTGPTNPRLWQFSAIRLIYSFLYEKEYLREPPDSMIELLDTLEGHFIDYLKEQFS